MNISTYILILMLAVASTSCDPGLSGNLKVYNETGETLTVKYKNYGLDTEYVYIKPNTNEVIKVLSALGDKKKFDCCPCQMKSIYVQSGLGQIKKDPNNSDNWIIPNKNKLKRYGKEPVKCEFHNAGRPLEYYKKRNIVEHVYYF